MCLTSSQSSLPGSSRLMRFLEVAVEVGGWAGVKVRCQHVICGSLMLQLVEKKRSSKHHFCAHFCACSSCAQEKRSPLHHCCTRWFSFPLDHAALVSSAKHQPISSGNIVQAAKGLYTLFAVEFCLTMKGSTRLM